MAIANYEPIIPKDAMAELYGLVQSKEDKINELTAENDRLIYRNNHLLDENNQVREEKNLLQEELIHMQNTRSWKITEPLRRIEPFLNRNKKEFALNTLDNSDQSALDIQGIIAEEITEEYTKEPIQSEYIDTDEICTKEIIYEDLNQIIGQEQISWERSEIKCKVSVIIPTLNAEDEIDELLTSLKSQEHIQDLEIIVVDSGSTDETISIASGNGAKVVQMPPSEFSHSKARNLGAKNASGEILVFMVQDALPGNTDWLAGMSSLIYQNKASAVSCTERQNENTDEYYKIGAKGYELFRCIENGKDVVNTYVESDGAEKLRRKASLSDVGLAIKAELFRQFQYRYDFAEDLDLGIRLLKGNNKIALLGSIYVQHGHNRNAEYYFKRWYLEKKALGNILDCKPETKDFISMSIPIASFLVAVNNLLNEIDKKKLPMTSTEEFFEKVFNIFDNSLKEPEDDMRKLFETYKEYPLVSWCFHQMAGAYYSGKRDYGLFNSLREYMMRSIKPYFEQHEMRIDGSNSGMIILHDCIVKQVAGIVGAELASLEDECLIKERISENVNGV